MCIGVPLSVTMEVCKISAWWLKGSMRDDPPPASHSPVVASCPPSTTSAVCLAVAKALSTALRPKNNAGHLNFSNMSSAVFSRH